MPDTILCVVESPLHPNYTTLYRELGLEIQAVNSQRKAISSIKKQPPTFIVSEFFYGYGNNYAGANVSNIDVLLHSLPRYAPETRVIVLSQKQEAIHLDKLTALFDLHGILTAPFSESAMRQLLTNV